MEKLTPKQLSVVSVMDEVENDEQRWALAYAWTMVEIGSYPKDQQDAMIDAMGLLLEFRSGRKIPKWVEEERSLTPAV